MWNVYEFVGNFILIGCKLTCSAEVETKFQSNLELCLNPSAFNWAVICNRMFYVNGITCAGNRNNISSSLCSVLVTIYHFHCWSFYYMDIGTVFKHMQFPKSFTETKNRGESNLLWWVKVFKYYLKSVKLFIL